MTVVSLILLQSCEILHSIMPELSDHKNQNESDITGLRPPTEKQKHQQVKELGGPKGKEPTRYGDWEKNGRCIDF